MAKKSFTLRVDEELLVELGALAKADRRSLTVYLELLLEQVARGKGGALVSMGAYSDENHPPNCFCMFCFNHREREKGVSLQN